MGGVYHVEVGILPHYGSGGLPMLHVAAEGKGNVVPRSSRHSDAGRKLGDTVVGVNLTNVLGGGSGRMRKEYEDHCISLLAGLVYFGG
jgi:hypothetical protein